jgi:hypothetical protein
MKRLSFALAALAGCAASPAFAQSAGTFSVSTGLDYSSGDYGGPDTVKILVAPVTASYRTDVFRVSATLPYLRIDGAGVVLGPDGKPLPGVPTTTGSRSGLGDLGLGASVTLPADSLGGLEVELGGRVKFPTSKTSKGLGTGETDFSVSADFSYPIGAWAPFVTLGYRMPGDPAGVALDNSFAVSAGSSVSLGKAVLIASYDYAEASSPFAEDSQELFAALNAPLSDAVSWTGYGTVGLSEGSPDFGVGVLFTFKWK